MTAETTLSAPAIAPSAATRVLRECRLYLAGVALSLILVAYFLRLHHADLNVPLHIPGDGIYYGLQVKTLIETGWVHENPSLSAPYQLELYDFAHFDNLHLAIMKAIALVTSRWAVVLNVYFLLTFPLTTITALLLMRRLGIHWALSLAGSLLFAFQPYHFLRGQGHIMLAAYYLLPLLVFPCLWLSSERSLHGESGRLAWWELLRSKRFWFSLVICLAASSAGHYYACFGCFFFLLSGVRASLLFRRWRHLRHALLLCCVTAIGFTVNLLPNIHFWATHGSNRLASAKLPQFAEIFGLKLTRMLLPIPNHRLKPFADLRAFYMETAPNFFDNGAEAIGLVASVGFIILIGMALWRCQNDKDSSPLPLLGLLTVGSVLLATVGGFGAVFSYVVNPQLHGYQRISIFLALFGLITVMWLLQSFTARITRSRFRKAILLSAAALLLWLGLADQTTRKYIPDYAAEKSTFARHEAFGAAIQAAVPPGTMIFQLPLSNFPFDDGRIGYDHFHLYLHTHGLRWSDPAMYNRPSRIWQGRVSDLPPEEMLSALLEAGFGGLLVDLKLNNPKEGELVRYVMERTDAPPLHDGTTRYFFDLRGCDPHRQSHPRQEPSSRDRTQPVVPASLESHARSGPSD
jgi:phosphoglycerol transferase